MASGVISPNIGGIMPRDSARFGTPETMASSRFCVGGTRGRPSESSASVRIFCAVSQSVDGSTMGQPLHSFTTSTSAGDARAGDGRAAEGWDECRMLARAARYRDVDVVRISADGQPVAVRLVAGALVGAEILLGDPRQMDSRAFPQLLADALDGVAVALQGRGMLRSDDDEHRALAVDRVGARVGHAAGKGRQQAVARGRAVIIEIMRAFARHHG